MNSNVFCKTLIATRYYINAYNYIFTARIKFDNFGLDNFTYFHVYTSMKSDIYFQRSLNNSNALC